MIQRQPLIKSMSNKNNYSSFGWTMVGITTLQSLMTTSKERC